MATFEDVLKAQAELKNQKDRRKAEWNETINFSNDVINTIYRSIEDNGGKFEYPDEYRGWINKQEEGFVIRTFIIRFPESSKIKPKATYFYAKRISQGYEIHFKDQNKIIVPSKRKLYLPLVVSLFYDSLVDSIK